MTPNKSLSNKEVRLLKAKSRTDAVRVARREIVALKRFKNLMKENAGKLSSEARKE